VRKRHVRDKQEHERGAEYGHEVEGGPGPGGDEPVDAHALLPAVGPRLLHALAAVHQHGHDHDKQQGGLEAGQDQHQALVVVHGGRAVGLGQGDDVHKEELESVQVASEGLVWGKG
jgi:hypothetical protein